MVVTIIYVPYHYTSTSLKWKLLKLTEKTARYKQGTHMVISTPYTLYLIKNMKKCTRYFAVLCFVVIMILVLIRFIIYVYPYIFCAAYWYLSSYTHRASHLISNAFSRIKGFEFWFEFQWSLFPRVQLTICQHWTRKWLGVDQTISHYMNQCWPSSVTHVCGTRGRWVKERWRMWIKSFGIW